MDLVSPDGILNLQAKGIQQARFGKYQRERRAAGPTLQKHENLIDLDLLFSSNSSVRRARFATVVRLNLSSNKIQQLTAEICMSLPSLEWLDLRANKVAEISRAIKELSRMRVLKLDKNELQRLPEELYELRNLQELTFQENKIKVLSPRLGQLKQLRKLNIAMNLISKIPEEIGNCQYLEALCIQNNRFAAFPCSFLRLTNLRELSFEWFIYAKPPRPPYVSKKTREGT